MKKIILAITFCAAFGCVLLPGCSKSKSSNVQSGRQAAPDEIRNISADEWFDRIGEKETKLGYAANTSANALVQKAKESDTVRNDIISKATQIIDSSRNPYERWQSCYILSYIGDKRGISPIIRALKDQSEIVRGVAACALGMYDDPDARASLAEAAN